MPWVRAGVGAVATQGGTQLEYGNDLLDLLGQGVSPKEALDRIVALDEGREFRQVGVIGIDGRSAQWTGSRQYGSEAQGDWVAERSAPNFAAQGNSLVGVEVIDVAAYYPSWDSAYAHHLGLATVRDAPQPLLTGMSLQVEIHPGQGAVLIRGSYSLVNPGEVPIDTIHLAFPERVRTGEVAFDRPATNVLADDVLGHQAFVLETPIQPGESLRLDFAVRQDRRIGGGQRNAPQVAGLAARHRLPAGA